MSPILLGALGCVQEGTFAEPATDTQTISVQPRWLDIVWSQDGSGSVHQEWGHVSQQALAVAVYLDTFTSNVRFGVGYPNEFHQGQLLSSDSSGHAQSGSIRNYVERYIPNNVDQMLTYVFGPGEQSRAFIYSLLTGPVPENRHGFPSIDGALSLIVVSDESDYSISPDVNTFIKYINQHAKNYNITYNSVIDVDAAEGSCGLSNLHHVDVTNAIGGRVIPFCPPHPWSEDIIDLIEEALDTPVPIALPTTTCASAEITVAQADRPSIPRADTALDARAPSWLLSTNPPTAHIALRYLDRPTTITIRQPPDCP